jgi:predicted transcriptional regulator
MRHAVISIHPEHVTAIVGRVKTVEVRTRNALLESGARLWIYATLPAGQISAVAEVVNTYRLSPSAAWDKFRDRMGLSRSLYRSYVNGSALVTVIKLGGITVLGEPLSLKLIRAAQEDFQPPQFLRRLRKSEGLYKLLARKVPRLF